MVDQKLNLYSRTQQEIVKLLTVSKLYEYNGDKVGTKEFLQRAEKLISDRYRSIEKERESTLLDHQDRLKVVLLRLPNLCRRSIHARYPLIFN